MKAQIHAFSCLDQTQAVSQTLYANLTQNNHLVLLRGNETIEVYNSDSQDFICKYSPSNQLKIARFIKVRNPNQGCGDFLVLEIAGKIQFITLRMNDHENELQVVSLHNFQNDVRLHEAAAASPQHGFLQSFNFEKEVFIKENFMTGEGRGERGRPKKYRSNVGGDSNELGVNISEQFHYQNDFGNDFRLEIISGWCYLADNDKLIIVQYKAFSYSETNPTQIDPLYCDVKCPSNQYTPFDIVYPSQIFDLNRCVNLQNPLPAYLNYFQKQLSGIHSQSDSKIIKSNENKTIESLDEKQKITGRQNKKLTKSKINDDEEKQDTQTLDEIQERINTIPNNDNIQANLNYFFKKSVSYAKHPLQEQLQGQINQQIQAENTLNINQMTGQVMSQPNPYGSHNKRLEPGPCIFAQEATIFEIHDVKLLNQSFNIEENQISQFLDQDSKNRSIIKDSDIFASVNLMILHKVHLDKVTGTDSKVPCFNLSIFDIQVFRDLHPAGQIKNSFQGIKSYKSPKIGLRTIVQRLNYYSRFIVGPQTELSSIASLQVNSKQSAEKMDDDKAEVYEKQFKPFDEAIAKNLKALSETDLIFVVSNISIYAIRFRVEQSKISKIFGQDDTITENLDSIKVLTTLVTEVQTSSICKIVESLNENERKPEKIIQQPLKDVIKVNLGEQIYGTKIEKSAHFVKGVVCQKKIDKKDLQLRFDGSTRFHSLPNNRLLVVMQNQEKWILHFQFDQADLDVASVHFVKINLQNQIPFPIMSSCIAVFLSDQKRMAIEINEDKEDFDKVWRDSFKTNKNSQEFQICISSYYHDTLVFKLLPDWSQEQKLVNEDIFDGSQLEQRQKTENSEVIKKKNIKNPIPQSYSLQSIGNLGSTLTPITHLVKVNRIQEDLTFTDLILIQGSQFCSSIVIVKDYLIQKKKEKKISGISILPLESECLYKLNFLQQIQSLDTYFGQLIFLSQSKLDEQKNLTNDEGVTKIYEFKEDTFTEVNYDTYKHFELQKQTIGVQMISFQKGILRSKDQTQSKKQLIVQANLNSNKLQVVELFEQDNCKQTRTHSILEAIDQEGNPYTIQQFLLQENSQNVICLASNAEKQKIFIWKLFNSSQTISTQFACPKYFKIVRIVENEIKNIRILTIDQTNNFQIFKINGDVLQIFADYGQALALQSQDLNVKKDSLDGPEIIDFSVDYFGSKLYLIVLYSNCQFRLYQETQQFQFRQVFLQPKAEAIFSNCYSELRYSQQKRFIFKSQDQFIILPPKDDIEIQKCEVGLKPSGITISFRQGRVLINLLGLNQAQENLEGFVSLNQTNSRKGKTFLQIIKNKNQLNKLIKYSYPIQGSFDPLHHHTPLVSELCLKQIYPTVNEKPISIKFCQISSCQQYIVLACFQYIQCKKKPKRQIIDQGFSPENRNMAQDLVYSIYVYKMPQTYHLNSTNTDNQTFNQESALFLQELLCQLKKFEDNELINEMKFLTLDIEGVKEINDQKKYNQIKEKDEFLIVSTIKQDEKMEKGAFASQIYVMKLQEKDNKYDLTVIQKIQKEKLISGLASYKGRLISVQNMQQDFQIVLQQVKIIKTEENTLKYFLDKDSTLQFPQSVQNMASFLTVEKMGPLRQLGDKSLFDTESIFVGDIYRGFQIFTCKNKGELDKEKINDKSRIDLQKRIQSKISGHCSAIHAFNLLKDNVLEEKTDKFLKTTFILYAAKDGSLRIFQDGISKNLECTGFQHLKDNIIQVLPLEIENSTEMLNRNFLILPRRGGLISVSQMSFLFYKTLQGIAIELSQLQSDSGISPQHLMTVQGRDQEYAGGNIQTMQNLGINPSAALLSYPRSSRAQVEMIDRGFRNIQLSEGGEKKHETRNSFSQHQFHTENTLLDARIVLPLFFQQDYHLQENIALQLGFVDRQDLLDLLFSEM